MASRVVFFVAALLQATAARAVHPDGEVAHATKAKVQAATAQAGPGKEDEARPGALHPWKAAKELEQTRQAASVAALAVKSAKEAAWREHAAVKLALREADATLEQAQTERLEAVQVCVPMCSHGACARPQRGVERGGMPGCMERLPERTPLCVGVRWRPCCCGRRWE